MGEARLLVGNVFDVLAGMDDECVDMVMTSPPFLALRNYLPADHPDKSNELGQESTPAAYLDNQLRVVAAVDRVLAPHGSICWEIGDTFSGSGGAGGDYADDGIRAGQPKFKATTPRYVRDGKDGRAAGDGSTSLDGVQNRNMGGNGWPLSKSLCGVPTLFAWSLAYGRNLLTGEPSPAGQWIIRNVVVWARPNPPVGDLHDKFRPGTSYLTIATRARDRYFDLDAVRQPHKTKDDGGSMQNRKAREIVQSQPEVLGAGGSGMMNPGGAPPLDWWEPWPVEQGLWDWWQDDLWKVISAGYPGAHYAVFPPALCVRPIKTMCPERVCRTCGQASRRIIESTRYDRAGNVLDDDFTGGDRARGMRQTNESDGGPRFSHVERVDKGWTDCGHDDWRPGVVLDPFAGSGTTLAVATGHGRDAIGIDLDQRNADLCLERVGMFLRDIVLPLKDVPPSPVDDELEPVGML